MDQVHRNIWILLVFCLVSTSVVAQDSILSRKIQLSFNENTLLGHVDNLLIQENISLSFNSSRVDLKELIILPKEEMKVSELIQKLFYKNELKLTPEKNKVLITFLDARKLSVINIKGHIRDFETGEALVGASISELNSFSTTFSNETGFFSLSIPIDSSEVRFSYLGYKSVIKTDFDDSHVDIMLEFDNELTQVVIKESISDNFLVSSGGTRIDLAMTEGFQSTEGGNDLIKSVKINAGVQSGNEGQSGLLVRGGSHDQNLVLFEGIPMYEVSHAAGFSSMFIEESIRNVDFIKNGFPARYGGRLSSVLNVQLKDGNKSGVHGSVTASLPSIKAHLEGPIFDNKTTFNLSGRLSYLNTYFDQTLGKYINYDIGLKYNDFVGKVTHNFSPARKVSFSYYKGGDDLGLARNIIDINPNNNDSFYTTSDVNLRWGSTTWNFNLSNVVNNKLQLSFNLGSVDYRYVSRGSYTFESTITGLFSEAEREVVTLSRIEDFLANINFDYYLSDKHVLKFGAGWIVHNYKPAVSTDQIIRAGVETIIEDEEQIIAADELSFYIEDTYDPNENWQFYAGLHFAGYNVGFTRYRNTQPRLSAIFKPGDYDRVTLSYTKMNQYVHLLVNAGIGLPSNLWVPSTDDIKPESADQVSLSYSRKLTNSINFSVSGYYKFMQNLLEYQTSEDLIFFGSTNQTMLPLEDSNWQDRVEIGESTSKGLEFQIQKNSGKWTGWLAYTLSKTDRTFESIDNGQPFPYRYDRLNDLSAGMKYHINETCSISGNWVYGSGNNFSLSIEEFKSPFGILRTSGLRNNYQQQAFHHLDFQFNYTKNFDRYGKFILQIGVYNVYNRKNPYFIYIYNSPTLGGAEARKTSLFPILPNINIGYSF